jgi:Ca-activated chloride channel family protein
MTYKRDEQGQIVVTRYHPEFLQAAADAAGGTFVAAEETDKAGKVKIALATLRTQARASLGSEDKVQRFQWFAVPAVLLLLLDTLVTERRGRRRLSPAAAQTAASLVMLIALGGCVRFTRHQDAVRAFDRGEFQRSALLYQRAMQDGDRDPETMYNFGTALLRADSLDTAAEVLERLADARDEELRYRALFNLGLAHLVRGLDSTRQDSRQALDAALATYKKVILMRPDDVDAKWNYELALQKQQQGGGGGGGGGQGQSQDQQKDQSEQQPQPQGGLGQRQAEQLLGSAAREERDVQAKRQQKNRVQPPPGGKDW